MAESIIPQSVKYTITPVFKYQLARDLGFSRTISFTETVISERILERYNHENMTDWTKERFYKAHLLPPGLANFIHQKL